MTDMMILTADEFIALDVEGRGPARRAAREAPLPRRILRAFLDRGGPIPVEDLVADVQGGSTEAIHQALIRAGLGDSLFYTSDGVDLLHNDALPGILVVINFGPGNAKSDFAKLAELRRGQPGMTGEYRWIPETKGRVLI